MLLDEIYLALFFFCFFVFENNISRLVFAQTSGKAASFVLTTLRAMLVYRHHPHHSQVKEPLPPFIDALVDALVAAGVYQNAQDTIGAGAGAAVETEGDSGAASARVKQQQQQHEVEEEDGKRMAAPRPNHVLCNEYVPGQGIKPHKDGPRWFPRVAILSLSNPILFHFWPPATAAAEVGGAGAGGGSESNSEPDLSAPAHSILCMPRSLLVFEGRAYKDLYHGIAATQLDTLDKDLLANYSLLPDKLRAQLDLGTIQFPRQKRASLTLRHVLRTVEADTVIATSAAEEERSRSRAAFIRSIDS